MLVTTSMNVLDSLSPNAVNRAPTGMSEYIMSINSGPRPSQAQLDALIQNLGTESMYNWNVPTLVTQLTGKTIISMMNTSATLPIEWDAERVAFKFSALQDQAASQFDDAPTWGLLGFWPRYVSGMPTNWQLRSMLYFTIGDQNSGEDMLIQGGVIPKGTMWKPNDIVLTLTGAVK